MGFIINYELLTPASTRLALDGAHFPFVLVAPAGYAFRYM